MIEKGKTLVMGIVNVTPDSFYDGGRLLSSDKALQHALKLIEDGADILDIGGESTRPGAPAVSVNEEIDRVIPLINRLASLTDIPLSIDTTKAEVAKLALNNGATIVNDISAGLYDPEILKVTASQDAWYIGMHMRGTPLTMQKDTKYSDIFSEMMAYFEERLVDILKAGISKKKIILDPGIGFGKSAEQNYNLIADISILQNMGYPLLVGPSRKSFLKHAGIEDVENRLAGTLAVITSLTQSGGQIVRVHDVAEAIDVTRVTALLQSHGTTH